jgi:hypothetical protein
VFFITLSSTEMPAPKNNEFAKKAEAQKINAPKQVRGLPAERAAWNRAQAKSGFGWNDWARRALNREAGVN